MACGRSRLIARPRSRDGSSRRRRRVRRSEQHLHRRRPGAHAQGLRRLGAVEQDRLGGHRAVRRHRPRDRGGPQPRAAGLVALPEPAALGGDPGGEAKAPNGLYRAVPPADIKQGDILVRTTGAGSCGKMAILGGRVGGEWMTLEAGELEGSAMRTGNPLFFDGGGKILRPDVAVYRIDVHKDATLAHVRELRRDLEHLERTIAERPPLIARNGRAVVDEKVHDLVDEAWSLVADNRVRSRSPRAHRARAGAGRGARLAGRVRGRRRRARRRAAQIVDPRRRDDRARVGAPARRRDRQGGGAGRERDAGLGRPAARALRAGTQPARRRQDAGRPGGAQALLRQRSARSARAAAAGVEGRRSQAGAAAAGPA